MKSATDEGSGGIAVALAKSALINGIGARFAVTVEQPDPLERALLFYEANGSVYLSTSPSNTQRVIELAKEAGVVCSHIGHTVPDVLQSDDIGRSDPSLVWTLDELRAAYTGALEAQFAEEVLA